MAKKTSKKRSADDIESGDESSPKRAARDDEYVEDDVSTSETKNDNENDNEMVDDVEGVEESGSTGANENDNGDEEIDEELEGGDDNEGTAGTPARRKINAEGRPAEAGIIKSVLVENFMCHRKLKVDLCRNVNFIHGQNGSGKSAILAAIQICLGAGARRTHRATNLKDLVRKDAGGASPSAKLRVTLLNEGGDGYKQDIYGNQITVERSISLRGGYNGYKLLDENDHEVSRSKKDLDDMLDHLNIQVENPVAILDQEEAKKFLTGKASDKYAFFMKATELARIDQKYAAAADLSLELEQKSSRLKDSLEAKRELVKTLKKKVEEFEAVGKLEGKLLELHNDFAWAFFRERDEEYQVAVSKMNEFQQKADAKQLELSQAEEEVSGGNDEDEKNRVEATMAELQSEAEKAASLKRQLEADLKIAQNPVKQKRNQKKSVLAEKTRAAKDLNRAKKRLKDVRDEILAKAGSAESEDARRTALLKETEEALEEAKGAVTDIRERIGVSHQKYEEIQPELEQAKYNVDAKSKVVYAVTKKIERLQDSSTNDNLAIFGPECSKMRSLFDRHRNKFRSEVIGPVGKHLTIVPGKEKYAELADVALGKDTLGRFIVTNDDDFKACKDICDRNNLKLNVGQVKVHSRYPVPPPPADGIETVASVLNVDNDTIFNALVDQQRIEKIALAPSKDVSEEKLLVSNNGRYSIKGDINEVRYLPAGDKWIVRDGAISLSSQGKGRREKRIGVDVSAAILEAKEELKELEAELGELKSTHTDLARRSKEFLKAWNDAKRDGRKNEDKINSLTRKKEEIETEIETTATETIDTTEMEEDVAEAEEALARAKEQEEALDQEIAALKPQIDEAQRKLEEVTTRNGKVLEEMKQSQEDLAAIMDRVARSESDLERKRVKVKKYLAVIEEHQARVDELSEEREKALRGARELTLRQKVKMEKMDDEAGASQELTLTMEFSDEALEEVEIKMVEGDPKKYDAKIKRTEAKIEKERERRELSHEDPVVATEKWLRAKTDLHATQTAVDDTEKLLKQMSKDMKARRKRWEQLHKHLKSMTDSRFDEILRLNKQCGTLEFDDNELHLVVQKDINDESTQTKDVKALSGGERSYTTISLLLALGESLETPFRVLDEFDVFLDTHARKLTIQTLIHIAKTMEHRQFIFITPQDLSSVTPDPKLKIFKLKPPVRNGSQVADGLTQQTLT